MQTRPHRSPISSIQLDNPDNIVRQTLAVVPVLNESATIAHVVKSLQAQGIQWIRVVDNGSTDDSAARATAAGAQVLVEPVVGYGQACWRGLQDIDSSIQWILFCDGDGSDDLEGLGNLFAACESADLILGDRTATAAGRRNLTVIQRFGNWLATSFIYWGWGYRYRDLGPLRLVRLSALERLQLSDRAFGWTLEMQVRAVEETLEICEIPVNYHHRQGGKSKISGTITGGFRAGKAILGTLARLYWRRLQ